MAEYIEREAVCDSCNNKEICFEKEKCPVYKVSPADVVEVVRCKDCRRRNTPDCAMWYQCSICGGQWDWCTDNDYCSLGARKNDNT